MMQMMYERTVKCHWPGCNTVMVTACGNTAKMLCAEHRRERARLYQRDWKAQHPNYAKEWESRRRGVQTFGTLRVRGLMERFEGTCEGPCHRKHRDDLILIDGQKLCIDCRFYGEWGEMDEEMQRRSSLVRTKVRFEF